MQSATADLLAKQSRHKGLGNISHADGRRADNP
jgi:prepilin-type processing-associated H-X9-DG protein